MQVIPHISNAIQDWIERVAQIPVDSTGETPDVCVIELGGTVGDIESAPFIEALRQFQFRVGKENFLLIHVSFIPITVGNEQKTKPTQNTVRDLRGLGLTPDILACRSSQPLETSVKEKISMFCHVPTDQILAIQDCESVYHVPLMMREQGMIHKLTKLLSIAVNPSSDYLDKWAILASNLLNPIGELSIALVGKYTHLHDCYISVTKSLNHSSMKLSLKVNINWIESSELEEPSSENYQKSWDLLKASDGILVPGGFGGRGTEGKIKACQYAREAKVPFLGLCYGMQLSVIEHARNVLGMAGASSTEIDPATPFPVIVHMDDLSDATKLGGTMRIGLKVTKFKEGTENSKARALYSESLGVKNVSEISERHRHRYEVNPELVPRLETKGLSFVGRDVSGIRMSVLERTDHPFYLASQYHPELLSRPIRAAPLFVGLLQASAARKNCGK